MNVDTQFHTELPHVECWLHKNMKQCHNSGVGMFFNISST